MVFEHKLVRGGQEYLPMARKLIARLRATGLTYASQTYTINDVTMKVRVVPGHNYIDLQSGGEPVYQFATSSPVHSFLQIPNSAFVFTAAFSLVCKFDEKAKTVSAKAIGSSVEPPDLADPKWKYTQDSEEFADLFPVKDVFQIQCATPLAHFSTPEGKSSMKAFPFTVSGWDRMPYRGFKTLSGSRIRENFYYDIGFDLAPTKVSRTRGAKPTAPDSDWYRAAASRVVIHPDFGSRRFVLMTTVTGSLYVYVVAETFPLNTNPLYAQQAIKTNVPDKTVKAQAIPVPTWVRASTAGAEGRDLFTGTAQEYIDEHDGKIPLYTWSFNSRCTRMCAVVFEDLPVISGQNVWLHPYRHEDNDPSKKLLPLTETNLGMVEVSINIELTGPEDNEFEFSLEVVKQIRPSTDDQFVIAANYSWGALEGNSDPDAPDLDDLILLKADIYYPRAPSTVVPSDQWVCRMHALKGITTLYNDTKQKVLRKFVTQNTDFPFVSETLKPTALQISQLQQPPLAESDVVGHQAHGTIVAFDLRVQAFVFQQKVTRYDRTAEPQPNEPSEIYPRRDVHTYFIYRRSQYETSQTLVQFQVYMRNELVETKVLDGISPLTAKLNQLFADVDSSGLFRYSPNDVGDITPTTANDNDYWSILTPTDLSLANYLDAHVKVDSLFHIWGDAQRNIADFPTQVPGEFHAGAYMYAAVFSRALLQYDKFFAVHPDGRWSVDVGQFFYYSGVSPARPTDTEQPDFSAIKQTYIDVVNFRYEEEGVWKNYRTTHLGLINQALGKGWAEEDFFYKFRLETQPAYPAQLGVQLFTDTFLVAYNDSIANVGRFLVRSKRTNSLSPQLPPTYRVLPDQWSEINAFTHEETSMQSITRTFTGQAALFS